MSSDALDVRVRLFRLLVVFGQELRTRMDQELRPGGMTTQQAALTGVVEAIGRIRRLVLTPLSGEYWRDRGQADQERVIEWFGVVSDDEAETLFELLLRLRDG